MTIWRNWTLHFRKLPKSFNFRRDMKMFSTLVIFLLDFEYELLTKNFFSFSRERQNVGVSLPVNKVVQQQIRTRMKA